MDKGIISIILEGASLKETERCRLMIHQMLEAGVFQVRNGKAILNFSNYGEMMEIEISMKTWNKKFENEPKVKLNPFEQFKIEITNDNSTKTY